MVVVPTKLGTSIVDSQTRRCEWMYIPPDPSEFDFGDMDYTEHPEVIHARGAQPDGSFFFDNGPPVMGGVPHLYAHAVDVETLRANGDRLVTTDTRHAAGLIVS